MPTNAILSYVHTNSVPSIHFYLPRGRYKHLLQLQTMFEKIQFIHFADIITWHPWLCLPWPPLCFSNLVINPIHFSSSNLHFSVLLTISTMHNSLLSHQQVIAFYSMMTCTLKIKLLCIKKIKKKICSVDIYIVNSKH